MGLLIREPDGDDRQMVAGLTILTWAALLVWGRGGAALVIMGLKWTAAERGGGAGETLDMNTWATKIE